MLAILFVAGLGVYFLKINKNGVFNHSAYVENILAENKEFLKNPKSQEQKEKYQGLLDGYIKDMNDARLPKDEIFVALARLFIQLGDLKRAISSFQSALDENGSNVQALKGVGDLLFLSARIKESLEYYTKAVKLDSKNAEIQLKCGLAYNKLGKNDEARRHYEEAIRLNPSDAQGFFLLGYLDETEFKYQKSVENYKKSIELNPENAESYYNLGNVYTGLNQFDNAISAYLQVVEKNVNHLNAWINLSTLSYRMKNYKSALRYLDEAVLLGYDAPIQYREALEAFR